MDFAFYFWISGLLVLAVAGSLFFKYQDKKAAHDER